MYYKNNYQTSHIIKSPIIIIQLYYNLIVSVNILKVLIK